MIVVALSELHHAKGHDPLGVANDTIWSVLKGPNLFALRPDSFRLPLVGIRLAAVRGDRGAVTLGRADGAIEERCPIWTTTISRQRFSAATNGMTASEQDDDGTGLALSFDWAPIRSRSGQNQTELILRIRYRLEPFWLDEMAHALRDLADHTMNRIVARTTPKQDA